MNSLVKKEIIIFGLKRSGKTTIAKWIASHEEDEDSVVLQNNTFLTLNEKLSSGRFVDLASKIKKAPFNLFVNVVEHMPIESIGPLMKLYDAETRGMASELGFGQFSEDRRVILLLMNSMNHLRVFGGNKYGRVLLGSYPRFRNQYESEFMGVTNVIPEKVCVFFERFLVEGGYRRDIEARLGLGKMENDEFKWARKVLNKWKGLDVTGIHPLYQKFLKDGCVPEEHLK